MLTFSARRDPFQIGALRAHPMSDGQTVRVTGVLPAGGTDSWTMDARFVPGPDGLRLREGQVSQRIDGGWQLRQLQAGSQFATTLARVLNRQGL
ncbi:MAG: hypothetical protein AB7P76_05770 [Candidatus Melainabacteria bacterium]